MNDQHQVKLESGNGEIHYVLGEQEFILNQHDLNQELSDVLCSDGSRAILVDGQYYIANNQTILYQEGESTDLTQYYINDHSDAFVVDTDEISVNNLFEGTEIVQLVEEDTADGQIIYYTDDNVNNQEIFGEAHQIQYKDKNIYPFKRIKLERQMLDFDEFVQQQQQNQNSNLDQLLRIDGDIQYVLEDGQICTFQTEEIEKSTTLDSNKNFNVKEDIDLSKITGKNLITGQTVTLHSYMEKLKKKLKTNNISALYQKNNAKIKKEICEKNELLNNLLDRKISIGRTKSGKRIIGKIIHVERKNQNDEIESENDEQIMKLSTDESNEQTDDEPKIIVKKCLVSKDSFKEISKTLGGVMEMESVRKKLENKNIVVKLIEKKFLNNNDDTSFTKSTSYSYGFMEQEFGEGDTKWKFVPDQGTQEALLDGSNTNKVAKYRRTTSLAVIISYGGKNGGKTIRVNLNPSPGNLCTICTQFFKTNLQLRSHMNSVHSLGNQTLCEVCGSLFDDPQKLQEHKAVHVEEGKLFICSECNKCFTSQNRLYKHLPTHDLYLRPLECSVCEVRCASEWALKKHLLSHTGIKPFSCDICHKQFMSQYDMNLHKKIHFPDKHFACDVCLRAFSRHSNLLRHMEIHKGSGALYKCDFCYCSYNYISSLTRHMVQNHIDVNDFRKRIQKI